MKVHRIELLVLDFEGIGVHQIGLMLGNVRNLHGSVMSAESRDIGPWEDENPLNHRDTQGEEFRRLFTATPKEPAR